MGVCVPFIIRDDTPIRPTEESAVKEREREREREREIERSSVV